MSEEFAGREELEVSIANAWVRDSALHWFDRAVAAESALEWLASDEAWQVTPQYQADGRYRFNCPPDSIYATPWGFARASLAARTGKQDA